MKRFFIPVFCALVLCVPVRAQEDKPQDIPDFAGLRIRIIETATGKVLAPLARSEFPKDVPIPEGATAHCYRHKDKICIMLVNSATSRAGTVAFGLNSNFGELSIGILPYGEKSNLPPTTVNDASVEFKLAYGKPKVNWHDEAKFVVPRSRQDVQLSLIEYGGEGKWKEVTEIANEHLCCGMLSLPVTNTLFGDDPAPGIPKTIIASYTIGNEDRMLEVPEHGTLNIQYDPQHFFYHLTPKTDKTFKFVLEK